jgi:hypothetical protein
MSGSDNLLRLHIEALSVLARTNQSNRGFLIERNVDDYLAEAGRERLSLERLRDAIDREDAKKRQGEDCSIAKRYVRSLLGWLVCVTVSGIWVWRRCWLR